MDSIDKDHHLPYTVRPFLPWRFHCWSILLLNRFAKVTVTSSLTKTSTESSTSTSATWKWKRKILRSQASKCEVPAAISIYNVPVANGLTSSSITAPPKWKFRLNIPEDFWNAGFTVSQWDGWWERLEAQWETILWGWKTLGIVRLQNQGLQKKSSDFLQKIIHFIGNLRILEFDPKYDQS